MIMADTCGTGRSHPSLGEEGEQVLLPPFLLWRGCFFRQQRWGPLQPETPGLTSPVQNVSQNVRLEMTFVKDTLGTWGSLMSFGSSGV